MESNTVRETARVFTILAGFLPKSALWLGDDAPFPSQASAEWALRRHRVELKRAQAVAMHVKGQRRTIGDAAG